MAKKETSKSKPTVKSATSSTIPKTKTAAKSKSKASTNEVDAAAKKKP